MNQEKNQLIKLRIVRTFTPKDAKRPLVVPLAFAYAKFVPRPGLPIYKGEKDGVEIEVEAAVFEKGYSVPATLEEALSAQLGPGAWDSIENPREKEPIPLNEHLSKLPEDMKAGWNRSQRDLLLTSLLAQPAEKFIRWGDGSHGTHGFWTIGLETKRWGSLPDESWIGDNERKLIEDEKLRVIRCDDRWKADNTIRDAMREIWEAANRIADNMDRKSRRCYLVVSV